MPDTSGEFFPSKTFTLSWETSIQYLVIELAMFVGSHGSGTDPSSENDLLWDC